MFATLLNKGLGSSLAVLIGVFFTCYLANLFSTISFENNQFPDLFYNYFTNKIHSKWLIVSLNYLCIALSLLVINTIAINQEIVEKQNYFPVFLYLLLTATASSSVNISAQLLTNLFILFSFYKLLSTYRNETALKPIFDAAFWLCISGFISISSAFTFPLFYIILFIIRPFSWREWLLALLGFIVPLIIYESLAYLSDFNQWYLFKSAGNYLNALRPPSISEFYLPLLIVLICLFLVSLTNSLNIGFGNTVKKQKAKIILLWFLLFSVFTIFSSGSNGSVIVITCSLPFSFFIGDYFYSLKQKKISNTILVVLLVCSLLIFLGKLGVI